MRIQLRFFASLREALGPGEALDWPAGADSSAAALRTWLQARSPAHGELLAPGRAVRVAVDQVLVPDDAPLHDGAEVAFFPPVTGG